MERQRKTSRHFPDSHENCCDYGLKPLILIIIFVFYQIIGALIFYLCEHTAHEGDPITNLTEVKLKSNEEITQKILDIVKSTKPQNRTKENIYALIEQELNNFEQEVEKAQHHSSVEWDFWMAMLYAQTLCTTIGYGNSYTITAWGRFLTMIYSLMGIPIVLSILDILGKSLSLILHKMAWQMKATIKKFYAIIFKGKVKEYAAVKPPVHEMHDHILPISIALVSTMLWIGLCAGVSMFWEDWTYFEAYYFFFISLSTIGLGEIMPSEPRFLLCMFVKMVIGLTLFSICVSSLQNMLEEFLYRLVNKINHSEREIDDAEIESLYERPIALGVFRSYGGSLLSLNTHHSSNYSTDYSSSKCTQTD